MHHERKVGANVSNPHSCTTYIMLNSIIYKLVFNDVLNARKCVRIVSLKGYFRLYRAYIDLQSGKHVVIVEALRAGAFSYDNIDLVLMTEGCKEGSFDWSFDVISETALNYYIEIHKK